MRIKRVILILSLLLLTGCTINYDLEFTGDKFVENIYGTVTNKELELKDNSTGINIYRNMLYEEQKAFVNRDNLYTKTITEGNEEVNYNFTYTYSRDNFQDSRIVNSCFSNSVLEETDEFYYIDLSGSFSCLYSDQIKINVKSDYMIIENNADKVKDGVYTWIIDDEDSADIFLTISKTTKSSVTKDKKGVSTFKIVGFVVLVILSVITYFLYKKKNNEQI